MCGPRLRTVNKAIAPFDINKFPPEFVETFAKEVVYMVATKSHMSLEGNEWEQIFASCIGAEWHPSNVGLDDVVLDNCCWGAKTVLGAKNLARQKKVRLIAGRNSLSYSYGIDTIINDDPDKIGRLVLEIWNERVSAVRQIFKFVRTVVLVKGKDYKEYLIFETDTIRYDADLYFFEWNKNNNLEGFEKSTGKHKFTWQPSGSQFTIIEDIPKDRWHIKIKHPRALDKNVVLEAVHFDSDWYEVIDSNKRE